MSAAERIDMRVDAETKQLAERASTASGCSLSQYLTRLIRSDAPKILEEASNISLTNEQFDSFIEICSKSKPLSDKIIRTAERLNTEGF